MLVVAATTASRKVSVSTAGDSNEPVNIEQHSVQEEGKASGHKREQGRKKEENGIMIGCHRRQWSKQSPNIEQQSEWILPSSWARPSGRPHAS